jgi:hypothetical protein
MRLAPSPRERKDRRRRPRLPVHFGGATFTSGATLYAADDGIVVLAA